jgi:hypothetical protein
MTFGELVETARNAGFELYDARQLPVDPELQMALEDENLTEEEVHVTLHPAPSGRQRGVVADLRVGEHVFHLWGSWSRVWELEQLVEGTPARPRSAPLGEDPRDR